jgi:hypothetical protein
MTGTVAGNTWTWKGTLIAGGKQYAMRGTDVICDDLKTDIYVFKIDPGVTKVEPFAPLIRASVEALTGSK